MQKKSHLQIKVNQIESKFVTIFCFCFSSLVSGVCFVLPEFNWGNEQWQLIEVKSK